MEFGVKSSGKTDLGRPILDLPEAPRGTTGIGSKKLSNVGTLIEKI